VSRHAWLNSTFAIAKDERAALKCRALSFLDPQVARLRPTLSEDVVDAERGAACRMQPVAAASFCLA